MKIVINADDYGRDERVTSAILECFHREWITQATLLVNMPYADEAVRRARIEGFADCIGLHLNFTEGDPLTKPITEFREICDKNGRFFRNRAGIYDFRPFKSEGLRRAIQLETRAQVEKYCSYGLPLMHCDGHHHIHNRSQFSCEVLPILKEYGFKTVRNRYSSFSPFPIRGIRWVIQKWIYSRRVREFGLAMTEGFGGWKGEGLQKWKKFNSFEIMVHPNYDSQGHNVNVLNFAAITGPEMRLLKDAIDELKFNFK